MGAPLRFSRSPRDDNGERQYSAGEVAKLRAIKRLMDVGMRPGKIIRQPLDELNALADDARRPRRERRRPREREILALAAAHDAAGAAALLAHLLMRQGMQRFVLETLAPLNHAVGDAWMRGELAGIRGAPLHRARAGRAAYRDQRLSAADGRAEGPAHHVPGGAARRRAC